MYILYVFVLTPDVYSLIVVKQDISRLYPTNQGKEGKTMTASGVIEREPRVAREAIARERVALRPATQKRLSINLALNRKNGLAAKVRHIDIGSGQRALVSVCTRTIIVILVSGDGDLRGQHRTAQKKQAGKTCARLRIEQESPES